MKRYFFLYFLLFSIFTGNSQELALEWVNATGASSSDEARSITFDDEGNIYKTGDFASIVDFDPNPETELILSSSDFWSSAFITKTDAAGNLIWANSLSFKEDLSVRSESIAIDNDQNIVIAGRSGGNLFVAKFDTNGQKIWDYILQGNFSNQVLSMSVTTGNDLILTGYFQGVKDFDPGPNTVDLTATGFNGTVPFAFDVFVLKVSSNGKFIWAKSFGGNTSDVARSLYLDEDDNIFISGWFTGSADFNPGIGTHILTSNGLDDIFVVKLDSNGEFIWADSFGTNGYEYSSTIKLDENGNNYILCKYRSNDFILQKRNDAGILLWTRIIEGNNNSNVPGDLAISNTGAIFISGTFSDQLIIPSIGTINSMGNADTFIAEVNQSGSLLSSFIISSEENVSANSVGILNDSLLYISGFFEGEVDFSLNNYSTTRSSEGRKDFFLAKYSNCFETSAEISVSACDEYISPRGISYRSSGSYIETIKNFLGCDSLITLDITISPTITNEIDVVSCDFFQPEFSNEVLTKSGRYLDTLKTFNGCDSLIVTNLTINKSFIVDKAIESCQYLQTQNGYYTKSGVYQENLESHTGCDSTVIIDFNLLPSHTTQIDIASCEILTTDSGLLLIESKVYIDSLRNSNECDSLVFLNFTRSDEIEDLFIPNVITPNGDDKNDFFVLDPRIDKPKISLFNRWGKQIYSKVNYENDWNGNGFSTGIYYYVIQDQCRKEYSGQIHLLK